MPSSSEESCDEKGRDKVHCAMCAAEGKIHWAHRLENHLANVHGMTLRGYDTMYPGSLTMSDFAVKVEKKKAKMEIQGERVVFIDDPGFQPDENPKELIEVAPVEDPLSFKIGCARLSKRTDLTDEEKALVPKFDPLWHMGEQEKEHLEFLAMGIESGDPIYIVGPTGAGKSAIVKQLAAICNQPLMRMNLHGDVRAADFVGDKSVIIDPATGQSVIEFKYGLLPRAMRMGAWLLLDEIDASQAHILFVLQAALEQGMRLVLSSNYGEVIDAHPNFAFIATANTLGKGDDTGLYTGTNMLNEAFMDRFGVVIAMDYPSGDAEATILVEKTGINRADADGMVYVANQIRKEQKNQRVYCTFGTRKLIHWASKAVKLGDINRAAKVSILNRLSEEDHKVVKEIIFKKWGYKPTLATKTVIPKAKVNRWKSSVPFIAIPDSLHLKISPETTPIPSTEYPGLLEWASFDDRTK